MATAATFGNPVQRKLMALLCKAAGVENEKVRSITCTIEIGAPCMFTVELLGNPEKIHKALEEHER